MRSDWARLLHRVAACAVWLGMVWVVDGGGVVELLAGVVLGCLGYALWAGRVR